MMGNIVSGLLEDTCWTRMIQSEVENHWTHLIGGVVLMDFILTLVPRDTTTITSNILIEGVRNSTVKTV